jgi:pimeloyl-ACP methyl ester carboxylesterase
MQHEPLLTEGGIPYLDLGGAEQHPVMLFSHANGYPPLCYQSLLEPLRSSNRLFAGLHRPLWPSMQESAEFPDWSVFADDLVALADHVANRPLVHVGHSMGAAAGVLAAASKPSLFKALILIEPAIVSRRYLVLLRLFARLAPDLIPLVRTTLNRTDQWPTRQDAFEHFRPKAVFKNIPDRELWDYVQYGTEEASDGSVRLTYSKDWEAHCYTRVHDIWQALNSIHIPTLAIRARDSNTIFPGAWGKWQRQAPQHEFLVIEAAGHLLPFEKPLETAEHIERWLHSVKGL